MRIETSKLTSTKANKTKQDLHAKSLCNYKHYYCGNEVATY
jgi:hypothetical protein